MCFVFCHLRRFMVCGGVAVMVRGSQILQVAVNMPLLLDAFLQKQFALCAGKPDLRALLKALRFCKDALPLPKSVSALQVCNYWQDIVTSRLIVKESLARAFVKIRKSGKTNLALSRSAGLRPYGQAR